MPNEIVLNIMGRLEITDNASLALTCKHLARIAAAYQILHFNLSSGPSSLRFSRFFEGLAHSWNLGDLKYCERCKKFRPAGKRPWREYVRKYPVYGAETWFCRTFYQHVHNYWWYNHKQDEHGPRYCPDCYAHLRLL